MNKISSMLGAQLEVTPFTGKYSLFGKLFAHYDFYAFVGPGALNYAAATLAMRCGDTGALAAPPATADAVRRHGLKLGVNAGVGLHSFINQFLALNFELRDIIAQDNPPGRDVNGDRRVDNNDLTWTATRSCVARTSSSTSRRSPTSRTLSSADVRRRHGARRNVVAQAQGDPLLQRGHAGRNAERGHPAGSLGLVDHPGGLEDRARRSPTPARRRLGAAAAAAGRRRRPRSSAVRASSDGARPRRPARE